MSDGKALIARREADAARADLLAGVQAIKHQLTPAVIAERAGDRVSTALDRVNAQVRARPAAAGAALGILMLVFARHRVARLFGQRHTDATSA